MEYILNGGVKFDIKNNKIYNLKENNSLTKLINDNKAIINSYEVGISSCNQQIMNNRCDYSNTFEINTKYIKDLQLKIEQICKDNKYIQNKIYELNKIPLSLENMTKILETKIIFHINNNNLKYDLYDVNSCSLYFKNNRQYLKSIYEDINNLYYSKSEKLIFTIYILSTISECKLEQFDIPKLEFYKKLYQLKDFINKDIIDLNILNNNGINTSQSYIDFIVDKNFPTKQEFIEMIKYEKFKKNLEDMIEVINKEIYINKNKEHSIDTIQQNLKLTKLKEELYNNLNILKIKWSQPYNVISLKYKTLQYDNIIIKSRQEKERILEKKLEKKRILEKELAEEIKKKIRSEI